MKPNKLILLVFSLLFINALHAANPNPKVTQFINNKDWNFVENKGQIVNTAIKYYGHQGGVYLYCKPGMLSFVFTKTENSPGQISEATSQPSGFPLSGNGAPVPSLSGGGFGQRPPLPALRSSISTSRADLVLLHANPSAQIIATDQQEYYENYYTTGDADHGITNVHTFKTVTYKYIYPHIDLVLHARESGMKYEFVVHPGGKVSDIQMQWNGLENMKMTSDGGMKYATALGKMEEGAPVSWQGGKVVGSGFLKNENRIGFKVGGFDKGKDLVIDPSLVWGTYYGGGNDEGYGVCVDGYGNAFITGTTYSSSGVASSGAYQTSYGGNEDAFLSKFNSNGLLLWATYYGGSGGDVSLGICLDNSDNAYITGNTTSLSGIATRGAYQTSIIAGANVDAFLAKFSGNGTLQWATYYGGSDVDQGFAVAANSFGSVYITGTTSSASSIATNGANQTSYNGNVDAFLAKFSTSGALQWATYYGGTAEDGVSGIATDGFGNTYITGASSSTSDIATNGAYQTSIGGGGSDAYLSKFSSSGSLQWATYYGGNAADYGSGVAIDGSGNAYITGSTDSKNNIATKGAYQTSDSALDVFLAKFSGNGSLQWATYYGGSSGNYGQGIATDSFGNSYITGYTYSANGIATSNAYQTSIGGSDDAFLAKFSGGGALKWATYYGGSVDDEGNGVAIDAHGNAYITGLTNDSIGIATSGTYQSTNSYGTYNAFLSKFSFQTSNDAGISSISNPPDTAICPGINTIKVTLKNYGVSNLTKVSIPWSIDHKAQTTYNWIGSLEPDSAIMVSIGTFSFTAGADTIKAWTYNPNGTFDSIPENDSLSAIFSVKPLPDAKVIPNTSICSGSYISIGASTVSGSSYIWNPSTGLSFSKVSNPMANPKLTTTYFLTETNQFGCSKTDSVTITVNPNPTAALSFTPTCPNDSTPFSDTSSAANSYSWSFGDGETSSLQNPKHLYSKNGTYNVNLKVSNSAGCADSASQRITISDCVWPGDANDDKVVDMKDFLTLGIAFGDTGLPRPSASIKWTGQPCPQWKDTLPGGFNEKYADCNGDSIVNYADTSSVSANYSLTHSKSSPLIQGNPSDPAFVITPLSDSVSIGKIFQAYISVGSQKNPVQNLYGMAFSIFADPSLFETDKATVNIIPSFFGTDSVDLMDMKINNSSNASIDLGLTRIDHTNASGYGTFAILSIPVKASIPQKNIKTALSISNNTQISFSGKNIPLYFSSDSTVVTQHTTAINPASQFLSGINIYPNPFSSSASVQYTLLKPSKVSIVLFDISGKEMGTILEENQKIGKYTLDIQADKYHLSPGVYLLKFTMDDGYVTRQLVKF